MVDKHSGVLITIGCFGKYFFDHDVKYTCVKSHLSEVPGSYSSTKVQNINDISSNILLHTTSVVVVNDKCTNGDFAFEKKKPYQCN